MINSKKKIELIVIISLLFFTFFIRAYNIGYDDLWFDEISSYWVSDPKISLNENLIRHEKIEKTPFLYFLVLKYNFDIFLYNDLTGRYLSLFFNVLGIVFSILTCKLISSNKAYIFALFMFASNIYLINYSQELRVYSFVFFLSSLYLYLFFRIYKFFKTENLNFFYFTLLSFSLVLMLISHPFCYIVFFSTSVFLLMEFFFKKRISKTLKYNLVFGVIFSFIYLFFLLEKNGQSPSWILQPDLKFYTNFYFSKFFGSRLMGLTHLILFLSLIFLIYKKALKKNFELNILLILVFFSYFIPIFYGYIISPIIFPRYIIFVLIPIIILLSVLIYEIENIFIRNSIITILIILNIGNHFFEASFQQFFKQRPFLKPNFTKMINIIKEDDVKSYTIQLKELKDENDNYYKAIEHYVSNLIIPKKIDIKYFGKNNFINSNIKKIWVICLLTIVKDKCENIKLDSNNFILKEEMVPGMRMVLISKNL
tara:strand:+ start:676 stop:2121 length:1446 start_codon:yes stop_codon:yes gene_type:complete